MAARPLEADCTECLEGFDSMITNPEQYPAAAEILLSSDDGMDFGSSDLWLPPLDSPAPSPQLPQQLPPSTGAVHIDAQLQYVLTASEAVHVSDPKLPQAATQSQLQLPRNPATKLRPSTVDCTGALQRLTAIASSFQQKSALLVCPAPVHAAASVLASASQLTPTRQQKTIDAAVLWNALQLYPHERMQKLCAKHFAIVAGVSTSTLANVASMLSDNTRFTTMLHLEMYQRWIASGDSERQCSPEPQSAGRGIKRGREEGAKSPSEQHASSVASLAEDAAFFPSKKIHVDRSCQADDHICIQFPIDSCQPTPGQLLLVMLTRHCIFT